VASRCGYTPQYEGLEALQQEYAKKGFSVLAFPCNQFGAQEPGTDLEIQSFCQLNYHTTFPVLAKVDVNGNLYVGDANNHVIRKLSPINLPATATTAAAAATATTAAATTTS
jgi:glutathione peroxidase-family protein